MRVKKESHVRIFLLILGWSSVVGSFGDGSLWFYALWIIGSSGWNELGMSVDDFLHQFVEIIYWVKQVAYYVMPHGFVTWLFGLPALIYFPVRIVMSIIIGWWALSKAEKMAVTHASNA